MLRVIIFTLLIVVFLSGCVKNEKIGVNTINKSSNITIKQIKTNPDKFIGKLVVIHGIYMGWWGDESPPVTRSDWAIDDGTGKIYVTGKSPGLDPLKDVGRKNVTVIGYVRIIGSKVYIEAVKVELD